MLRWLKNVWNAQLYLRNAGIYLAERAFGIVVSFVVYTALARSYGPSLIGTYSYSQTVMLFAVPFLAMGSEGVVIRELVRHKSRYNEIMGSAFVVLSLVGLVATLLPLLFIAVVNHDDRVLWLVSLSFAASFVPSGLLVVEQSLKADLKAPPIVIVRVATAGLFCAAKLYLIYRQFPIYSVVAATAVEAFVTVGLLYYTYRDGDHAIANWRVRREYALFLLTQSFPGMVAGIAIMMFFRANHILLVFLSDFETVGQYAVAFQVCQLFLIVPHVTLGAIYPRLVHLHLADRERYIFLLNVCYWLFAIVGYLTILGTYLFSTQSFNLVFGPKYQEAAQVTIILAVATLFNFLGAVRGRSIDIDNTTHYHVINSLVGFAVLFPLSYHLIPIYGAVGAAWSIVAAAFVAAIATAFLMPTQRQSGVAMVKALFLVPSFKMSALRSVLARTAP